MLLSLLNPKLDLNKTKIPHIQIVFNSFGRDGALKKQKDSDNSEEDDQISFE